MGSDEDFYSYNQFFHFLLQTLILDLIQDPVFVKVTTPQSWNNSPNLNKEIDFQSSV